ncbi:MAG: exosome complex exonuclease Rrp41 [Candidatus Aenigmarchaeota archaeon]|nr:exosome complex exonuclease Rrp41 [Candidatus Aenigmarchaeota archaeon]MCK5321861.1 exosome complex exonuclease Rrp41 [Candidatus Aenigmarchaeota archaeon]
MMGGTRPDKYKKLVVKGKRIDGRKLDEMRPVIIKAGVLDQADGSAYIEVGSTKILAGVFGPKVLHPKRLLDEDKAVLDVSYAMLPFSTSERARPGPSRRSKEISKVAKNALEPSIFLEEAPQVMISLQLDVISADAGTRAAAITAGSVALADAGIPMKGLVSACAAGKIDGNIALDLCGPEDNFGEADMPVAMLSSNNEITLLQFDGDMTKDEVSKSLELVRKGNEYLWSKQEEALRGKYKEVD